MPVSSDSFVVLQIHIITLQLSDRTRRSTKYHNMNAPSHQVMLRTFSCNISYRLSGSYRIRTWIRSSTSRL